MEGIIFILGFLIVLFWELDTKARVEEQNKKMAEKFDLRSKFNSEEEYKEYLRSCVRVWLAYARGEKPGDLSPEELEMYQQRRRMTISRYLYDRTHGLMSEEELSK